MLTIFKLDQQKRDWLWLVMMIVIAGVVFNWIGRPLISLLLSTVFAYLLQTPMAMLIKYKCSPLMATSLCVSTFFVVVMAVILGMIPPILNQANDFLNAMPNIMMVFQKLLNHLAEYLPNYLSHDEILSFSEQAKIVATTKSSKGLLFLVNLIPLTFEVMIYFVLIPMMLFFLIKDSGQILTYFRDFMPKNQHVLKTFWQRLDVQLGRYLQGKCIEMFLIGIVSALCYRLLGMKFALLMGCFMGIGVLIPIIGPSLVTLGVLFIGLWQFNDNISHFYYLMLMHGVLLLVDNNILVPLLFSDKLNLHPLAILVATLFFGAVFGFWGLFFAIPLLTAIHILADLYKAAFTPSHSDKV